ncbi:MAG: sialate O-acetylesterase [Sphingobacteriaceae bacterium]|nr:sialate O-acetylesterase [Sphingobacteriaceae bacterium]
MSFYKKTGIPISFGDRSRSYFLNFRSAVVKCCALLFAILLINEKACADVKLPQLIANRMVLQRNINLKIWGWANPNEKVKLSFNNRHFETITGSNGQWLIRLPKMKAGGPYTMTIAGQNLITLTDILVGDVYFCAGQSNMVLAMERLKENYPEEVEHDNFPQIRNFFVPTKADVSQESTDLPKGEWKPAMGKGLLEFGGVTYFFAKKLYQKYKVPIGIINSSVGGTPIEAWMSKDAFKEFPEIENQIKKFRDTAYINSLQLSQPKPAKASPPSYVPKTWHKFWMPGYWADQGARNLNGILYFRKEIEVPAEMAGKPAKLFMGRIIDSDSAFVNGTFVGNITYQYPPRRYNVPANLLKPGKNTILIKLTSINGKGGFVPDKNYSLQAGGQIIDLRGEWYYQVHEVFPKPAYSAAAQQAVRPIVAQNSPTGLYNTMVAPALNYGICGFLWYQGEANEGKAKEYAKMLPALIKDWRDKWGLGNIPFLFAQLPNYMEVDYLPAESNWAQLRQSQLQTLKTENTGMAVGLGAGEWNDIHPLNKKQIGERLALWAEKLIYGENNIVYSGPVYRSATVQGNRVILNFDYVGNGLTTQGEAVLYHFAIAGADKKYVWAKAKIEGNTVVVWNDGISSPVAVRYAWADNPEGANLYNKDGLPAAPFEAEIK